MPLTTMNVPPDMQDSAALEISLASALELAWLGLGTLVDVRPSLEIEHRGAIPASVHIPLFEMATPGSALGRAEQARLDATQPDESEAHDFLGMLHQLQHVREQIVLCVCNDGQRSLYAAQLLRQAQYPKALAVTGGFQAWQRFQAMAVRRSTIEVGELAEAGRATPGPGALRIAPAPGT
jgi:rhodanese-related sulfurtransferase